MELEATIGLLRNGSQCVNATGVKTKRTGLEAGRAGGNTGPASLEQFAWRP